MMRFHTLVSGALAGAILVPPFLGQAPIATLRDALGGTTRALDVLKGLEQRLQDEPAAALGLVLSATEPPAGTIEQREERLETLRNEVNLLQMQLDALENPVTTPDGEIAHFLGSDPMPVERPTVPVGITTGLDDGLRGLLEHPSARLARPRVDGSGSGGAAAAARIGGSSEGEPLSENAYSADPLRHGIACYRAARYEEAYELLQPLDDATAMYWQARVLERLNRMEEATATMEKAIMKGGEGFDVARAQTDLEFLRWKREFLNSLPEDSRTRAGATQEGHR